MQMAMNLAHDWFKLCPLFDLKVVIQHGRQHHSLCEGGVEIASDMQCSVRDRSAMQVCSSPGNVLKQQRVS